MTPLAWLSTRAFTSGLRSSSEYEIKKEKADIFYEFYYYLCRNHYQIESKEVYEKIYDDNFQKGRERRMLDDLLCK